MQRHADGPPAGHGLAARQRGLGMESFGVASTIPYTGAEFMVTAGEGRCGTGPRSKSKRKVDELSGEVASDDDGVEVLGVGQGRLSASAVNNGAQAKEPSGSIAIGRSKRQCSTQEWQ